MFLNCNAVTFNCCLTWLNGAWTRAQHVADAFYSSISHDQVDVICLQELITDFDGVVSRFLHHPFSTRVFTSGVFTNNIRLLSSGLCILSRWPIVEQDGHVFCGDAYHAERFMAKGILYAKIQMTETHILHVFNTHLQAWTNGMAADVREQQMREITTFMQQKLLFMDPRFERVIWGGDTNCDLFEHEKDLTRIFERANMQIVKPTRPMFSFDPAKNPLGATDDPSEYKLRANVNDVEENAALVQPQIFPKQLIDFFAILAIQAQSILINDMSVVPVQTATSFPVIFNWTKKTHLKMVSDHFAVRVQFQFHFITQDAPCRELFFTSPKKTTCFVNKPHLGWILVEIVFFTIVFLFLLFLTTRRRRLS